MRSGDHATEREIVRLVLERERSLDGLERLLGSEAIPAVKSLASAGVVVRHGELLWASPCLSWLDDLGLVVAGVPADTPGHGDRQRLPLRSWDA